MIRLLSLAFIFTLSGCVNKIDNTGISTYITPMQAIERSAAAAPKGIKGFFELRVQAIGKPHEVTFLNSELDYRDPRNISIAIHPKVLKPFKQKYGLELQDHLKDKTIVVYGESRRVKISFGCNGKQTENQYYYQTHVRVNSLSQIHIVQ